jgi:glycerol-3-phosphate dehydrogenase
MMRREVGRLAEHTFDVLVIGGGIYGAWIAYDAALRGLKVALVEQNDWGSGTSSASSKLIHGGLRYLEHGWFNLVRKALRERGRLFRIAPHRVRPLRFVLPVYAHERVDKFSLSLGLSVYDALGGLNPGVHRHRAYSQEALSARCPYLDAAMLQGGFSYSDGADDDARFTLEIVAGAGMAGAVTVNRVRVDNLLRSGRMVLGASVFDLDSGRAFEIKAKVTVNAAGPWAERLLALEQSPRMMTRLTKGIHLVMPKLPNPEALLLTAPSDGRVFFLIPWYGRTLLGTTDTDYHGDPAQPRIEPQDVDYLLAAVTARCPGLGWTRAHIQGGYVGLRTLQCVYAKSPSAVTREWSLEEPLDQLLFPIGGKFTSARVEACTTVDRVLQKLHLEPRRCRTGTRRFPWCPSGPWKKWLGAGVAEGEALGLDRETAINCAIRFAATLPRLHNILQSAPELARRIVPDLPFCWAEIHHAVSEEMARSLIDVLRRRIPLSILCRLEQTVIDDVAEHMARVLEWSPQRKQEEIGKMLGYSREATKLA